MGGMNRQHTWGTVSPSMLSVSPQPHLILSSGDSGASQSGGPRLGWLKSPRGLSPSRPGSPGFDADGFAGGGGGGNNTDIPTCVKELLEGMPPEVFTIQRALAQIPQRRFRRQQTAAALNRSPTSTANVRR